MVHGNGTRHFLHTNWNERAGIPKGGSFLHSSSLSAKRASTALCPETLAVGILSNSLTFNVVVGSLIFPAATSRSSCSSAPSAENGTSLATGRLRSRITTSSPPLAKVRYLLSRFFSSATFTLRIWPLLPHGYYSHERTQMGRAQWSARWFLDEWVGVGRRKTTAVVYNKMSFWVLRKRTPGSAKPSVHQ